MTFDVDSPEKQGMKFDQEKPRMDLLPPNALIAISRVLTMGARKYAPNNWRYVTPFVERYTASTLRHVVATMAGEANDPETGESHWAHVACCAMFMLELELEEKERKKNEAVPNLIGPA